MDVVSRLKKNGLLYGLVVFNFFISYMGTFYLAHNLFEVNKFIEAVIIGITPILSSVILSAILSNDKEKMNEYFYLAILPTSLLEKISIPVYEYFDAKIHGNLEENLGISSESHFIFYLIQGNIGSAYYYNGVYLLTTLIVIFISYQTMYKLLVISVLKKWVWFIVIPLCQNSCRVSL